MLCIGIATHPTCIAFDPPELRIRSRSAESLPFWAVVITREGEKPLFELSGGRFPTLRRCAVTFPHHVSACRYFRQAGDFGWILRRVAPCRRRALLLSLLL